MSNFKSKMHQIRFRLGLRPRPRWRSLQRSPDPLAGFKGALLLREGGKEKGDEGGREGRGEGVVGRREGRAGEGVEGKGWERVRGLSHQSKSTKICPGTKYKIHTA